MQDIQRAILTDAGRIEFREPLELPKASDMNQGWQIGGEYWTTTDPKGKHTLNMEGSLESTQALDPKKPHYVGFIIGADYKVSDELFWTGYEPPNRSPLGSKASFYQHYPRDRSFDFITSRAVNKKKVMMSATKRFNAKPCDLVRLEYEQKSANYKEIGMACPNTWTPTKQPTIKGNKLMWGGKRPYRMKVRRFLDLKLGRYNGFNIQFLFFSMNKGKRFWGQSEKVSLILESAQGVKKLQQQISE